MDEVLFNAWVQPVAFVDEPIRFWEVSVGARKTLGLVAGMVWLICTVGAYMEPRFRRRLMPWALAAAMVVLAAWVLEPPEGVRDSGLRIPYGPVIGGLLVLL